jgi:FixJ family two-component response regulator
MSDFVVHVIDDMDTVRKPLLGLLQSANFKVAGHRSGLAFLELASKFTAGCIITDAACRTSMESSC